MEKLIELFKQHKRETWTSYEYILFRDNDAWLQARCIDNWKEIYIVRQAEILSKKMGFIQRLVKNDKIDFDKIPNKIEEIWIPMLWEWKIKYWFDSSDYYWLLMLLSIQDSPIDFLCSVLK